MTTIGDIEWRLSRMEEMLSEASIWEEWHREKIVAALESWLRERKDIKINYSAEHAVMMYMVDVGDGNLEDEPIKTQTDLLVFIDKAKKDIIRYAGADK